MIPIYSNLFVIILLFRIFPIYSELFQFILNYSNLFQFIPIHSNLFQFIPIYPELFQIIQNYLELFQIVQNYSNLFRITILKGLLELNLLRTAGRPDGQTAGQIRYVEPLQTTGLGAVKNCTHFPQINKLNYLFSGLFPFE